MKHILFLFVCQFVLMHVLPTENLVEMHKKEGGSTVGTDPTDTTQQPVLPDSEDVIRLEENGPGHKAKKSADSKSNAIIGTGKQEHKLKLKDKKNSSETQLVKSRELRQLEVKLKKWEEELKLREIQLNEKENDRRRLEDYLRKTEARNSELEATIRTLYRKMDVMADSNQQHPVNGPPQYTRMQNTETETLKYTMLLSYHAR